MLVRLNAGSKAFSIIEVITVLIMMSILVTYSVSGFKNFLINGESLSYSAKLTSSLRAARAQAIAKERLITICPVTAGDVENITSINDLGDVRCQDTDIWNAWIIFEANSVNPETIDAPEASIVSYHANIKENSIKSNISGAIIFDPYGLANIDLDNSEVTGWNWDTVADLTDKNSWSYTEASAFAGEFERVFYVSPPHCSGKNARVIKLSQSGSIDVSQTECFEL